MVLENEEVVLNRVRTMLTLDPCDHEHELGAAIVAGQQLSFTNSNRDPEFRGVKRRLDCASVREAVTVMKDALALQASIAPRRECVNVLELGIANRDEEAVHKAFGVRVLRVPVPRACDCGDLACTAWVSLSTLHCCFGLLAG